MKFSRGAVFCFYLFSISVISYAMEPVLSGGNALAQDNLTQIVSGTPADRPYRLTLREALRIALRTYPGLGAAQQGIAASKAGIGVAQSQY